MYRLLIIDDEETIANGLFELFSNLSELPLDVYKAYSASEALSFMEHVRIDIVVTDIKMPGMDGIEIARKINEYWPACRIIFLTGHKNADYAIAAIKNNVIDYILKTESDDIVINAVKKAIRLIRQDNEKMVQKEILIDTNKFEERLNRKFIFDLFDNSFETKGYVQSDLDNLNISLKLNYDAVLVIASLDCTRIDREYQAFKINDILKQYIKGKAVAEFEILENDTLVWVMQTPSGKNIDAGMKLITFLKGILEQVGDHFEHVYKGTLITFAIFDYPIMLNQIYQAYTQLRRVLVSYFGAGSGLILTNNSLNEENSQIQKKFDDFYHNARDYKLLLIHLKLQLEKNHKDVFVTLLKDATDILKKNVSINFPPAIEIYYGIALTLMTFININNIIDKIVFKINPMRMFMIPDFKSWDEAVKYLFDVSAAIFEIRTNNSQQTELNITLKIKSYINNNLSGDLSLVAIADKLGLNPCYISRHFKSVEGINISQYISLKKVEKAREFLKSKDIKIHEVAKLLGFDSNSYFTKFFRKEQGLSPQEYRNKFI